MSRLFFVIFGALLLQSSSLAAPELKSVDAEEICFLDSVIVIDLESAKRGIPIQSEYSSYAQTRLSEFIKEKVTDLTIQSEYSNEKVCKYSGVVVVSLFPEFEGERFFITRYLFGEGLLTRDNFERALRNRSAEGLTKYDFPLDIEILSNPATESLLKESIAEYSIRALQSFLFVWRMQIIK